MKLKKLLSLVICLCMLHFSNSQTTKPENASDNLGIEKALDDYVTSVNKMDTILASKTWAINDSISFIHPRGHEKGWHEVKNNFYIKTISDNFKEAKLQIHDVAIRNYENFAFVEFYWTFNGTFRDGSVDMTTMGRESQVLKKENESWKILHVHYSNMPVTGEREGF